MEVYDVIVVGAGMAGRHAAIRAAQLGLSVICIEREAGLIQSCMITDCVPSKALLRASAIYEAASSGEAARMGIDGRSRLNLTQMMAYKAEAVAASINDALLAERRIAYLEGTARVEGLGLVRIQGRDGLETRLRGRNIVLATGSEPLALPGFPFDHRHIVTPADALALSSVPRRLAIVGGGATGLELGSIWRRLGAQVSIIEKRASICAGWDAEIVQALQRALERQGLVFHLSAEAVSIGRNAEGVTINCCFADARRFETVDADVVLVAIGRLPMAAGLDLDAAELHRSLGTPLHLVSDDAKGAAIWFVGDAGAGAMLAQKAMEEGIACAELIAGLPGYVEYQAIPTVIHTVPEAAMVGRSEEELRAAGIAYRVGRASFMNNTKARIDGVAEGFVKLLIEDATGFVLGAHMIGPGVGEIISLPAMALEISTLCEDLVRTCYPHPSYAETLRQAALEAGRWTTFG